MKMPFGIHKEKEISEVPRKYLEWLIGQGGLYGQLKDAVINRIELSESQDDELTWQERISKQKGYAEDDDGEHWRENGAEDFHVSPTYRYSARYSGFPNPNELLDRENLDQGLRAMANMSGHLDALGSIFGSALNQGERDDEEYF